MQPFRSFRPISARGTDGEIAFEPTALFPDPMLMCPDFFGARVDYMKERRTEERDSVRLVDASVRAANVPSDIY